MQISISVGFSILLLLLDKLVLEIDLDLFTVFYVSVLWVDLDLSNDLTVSFLLLLGVYTVLLNVCYLSVFSMSVLWVDLDLSINLSLSVLLLLGVYTVLLDACDFSVLLNVSILFFSEMGLVMAYFTT